MADGQQTQEELKAKTVLCVGAHPDDIDVTMGGTVAKLAAAGADIYFLVLTNGNKGSADPDTVPDELAKRRREEQQAAAKLLGVRDVYFCDYDDGLLEAGQEVKRDIVRMIRRVKPDVVITLDPTVAYDAKLGIINHSDHRAAGQAVLDAVYPLARDHLSFPELIEDGLPPHKTPSVLLHNTVRPNYYEDISEWVEQKLQSVAAHMSQFPDMAKIQDRIKDMDRQAGASAGVDYAESFVRIDII